MTQKQKPILCLDFDGTVHLYSNGWQDGQIYDPPVDGFLTWLWEAEKYFKIVVYSSRSKTQKIEMQQWWEDNNLHHKEPIEFAHEKPPAFLTIDDRALTFNGDWTSPQYTPENLLKFKPWNVKSVKMTRTHSVYKGSSNDPTPRNPVETWEEIWDEDRQQWILKE